MALSTLDTLERRLQLAGLTPGTCAAPTKVETPSGRRPREGGVAEMQKKHRLEWFSGDVGAPFFISPKHDGVRLISYAPPAPPATPLQHPRKAATKTPGQRASPATATSGHTPPTTTCYSRYGRPIFGLFWIEEELRLLRALCGDAALILDGELYLHQTDMHAPTAVAPPAGVASVTPHTGKKKTPKGPRTAATAASYSPGTFQTGFLAVSALVNRLRGSTSQHATTEDILQYVPTLPRLCVFDVPSYSPNPSAVSPTRRVLSELHRIRNETAAALQVADVEQLRIVPNVTPFSQRLRTMHFLFELLTRGMQSPALLSHFCPTVARVRGDAAAAAAAACAPECKTGIDYHGGYFVRRIPYQLVSSLADTTRRVAPAYVTAGYEGAVIRAAVNTYEFREKKRGTLSALVAPLLQLHPAEVAASAPQRDGRRQRMEVGAGSGGSSVAGRSARCRAALLLSLDHGAASKAPLIVRAYRGGAPALEPMHTPASSVARLAEERNDTQDVGRRAVRRSAALSPRSSTAVKVLTYHDREYVILRPLLKEPSTNPKTRELASVPRSSVTALGYPIKPNTDTASDAAAERKKTKSRSSVSARPPHGADAVVCFYGLQCLAENGLTFNVSLPAMTPAQQEALLTHLLSAGRTAVSPTTTTASTRKKRCVPASGEAAAMSPSDMTSLTGLYATVKYSTFTEHGLPRFGSVKAIRGSKGWFM
ncbi:DNA ligase [Novymonas esmeraldas]|uniref:DNA ligase n=1 Tax=Novymonas esmeraldas TaxID=1808958 RepID=A0AAW0F4J2_9TRYP